MTAPTQEFHVDKLLTGRNGDAEYEAHLAEMMKRRQVGHAMICEAISWCANVSVIYGLLEKDRSLFLEDQQRTIEWFHEGYLRGEMKPLPGSCAAYIDSFAKDYAGKKGRAMPAPEDREPVMLLVMESLIATIVNAHEQAQPLKNADGNFVEKTWFKPDNDTDPKRRKVIDQLNRLNGELPL